MVRIHILAAASALAMLAACGQTTSTEAQAPPIQPPAAPSATNTMAAADFMQMAASSDAYEIQASQLAADHASRQQVKDFATMMVHDHTATTMQLTHLAQTNNMTAPAPVLDATHQQQLDRLRGLNGEQFDDLYLDQQIEAHENAVNAFRDYAANGEQGPLRDWAQTTLPKLQGHLDQAHSIDSAT